MRPCLVCNNENPGELSRHHLIAKQIQKDMGLAPKRQMTIKLCKDKIGCQAHHLFHLGDVEAAKKIRMNLPQKEIQWMVGLMGSEWVKRTYPPK